MNIRAEIAFHPEIVAEAEKLIKQIADVGAGLATTAVVGMVPVGGTFLRPLIAALIGGAEADVLKVVDHWLDGLTQAQPDVVPGDGRAGLVSIEELPAR